VTDGTDATEVAKTNAVTETNVTNGTDATEVAKTNATSILLVSSVVVISSEMTVTGGKD